MGRIEVRGENGGSRPKLRLLDGDRSMVEQKKGMKNEMLDQNDALRELRSRPIGEYNALNMLPAIGDRS